jgi:hypothetical protein
MIAHPIKSFTLWEFLKARALTRGSLAGLDPASRFFRAVGQGSGTPGRARGDGWEVFI